MSSTVTAPDGRSRLSSLTGPRAGKWPRVGIPPAVALLPAGYAAARHVPAHYGFTAVTVVPIGVLIASVADADARGRRTPFGGRVLVWLGEVSFAFYLCQGVTVFYVRGLVPGTFPVAVGVLVIVGLFAVTLLGGWLLHRRVELPMTRRWSRPRRAPEAKQEATLGAHP
jgi:peptidoglycan/LPS O-acetylase OafA/YrhL